MYKQTYKNDLGKKGIKKGARNSTIGTATERAPWKNKSGPGKNKKLNRNTKGINVLTKYVEKNHQVTYFDAGVLIQKTEGEEHRQIQMNVSIGFEDLTKWRKLKLKFGASFIRVFDEKEMRWEGQLKPDLKAAQPSTCTTQTCKEVLKKVHVSCAATFKMN